MSNYSSLKATINANVKTNGNQEITGQVMNAVLNAMVNSLGSGYQYMGIATPTNPGTNQTPDDRCFYIATTPGTYSHLGGLVVNDGEVAILKYDSAWSKEVTGAATAAQVTQLGQELYHEETIDGMQIATIEGKAIHADGSLSDSWNYRSCIIPNDGYTRIVGHGSSYSGYLVLAFYNSATPNASSFISGIAETTNYTDLSFDVSIPDGTVTIVVGYTIVSPSTVAVATLYKKEKITDVLQEEIDALASPDASMSDTSERAVQNKVIKSYIDSVTGYPITKLPAQNNNSALDNYGKLVTNGWLTGKGVSDFFPVSGSSLYVKSGVYQGGTVLYSAIAFYSAENEDAFVGAYIHSTYSTNIPAGYYSIPQGAQYARVVLGDDTVPAIVGGGADKSIAQRLSELSVISKNYGKSIVVFGGSHSARNNSDAAKNVWRDKLGMEVNTASVGSTGVVAHLTMYGWTYNGTTYYTRGGFDDGINSRVWDDYGYLTGIIITAKTDSSITLSDGNTYSRDSSKDYESNAQTKVARLVSKSALNKDIYLIWLSTNDYRQGFATGSFTDYTESDNYDTTKIYSSGNNGTYCGGFNYIVKTIRDNNPTAEIYVFTSLRCFDQGPKGYDPYTTDTNTTGKNFYEYQQEVLKAAQVAGCAILDQFMLQGIGINNYTEFYESDSLHLKVSGYERIADVQASFLSNGK